jgi:hypothetical protein
LDDLNGSYFKEFRATVADPEPADLIEKKIVNITIAQTTYKNVRKKYVAGRNNGKVPYKKT